MFSTCHSRCSIPWWIAKAFAVKWQMLIAWICSQELGFVLKSEQREALELLLRGKDVFCVLPTALFIRCLFMQRVLQVPCKGRPSLLSDLCKIGGSVGNTWLLPRAKMLLVPMNCFLDLCRVDYALEENVLTEEMWILAAYWITERTWHAFWFALVGMICPLCPLMQEHFLFWPL